MVLSDGECSLETGVNVLKQGSPTPGFLLGTGSHSRRWAVGNWLKLHPYLEPLPTAHLTAWAMPPVRSVVARWMQCAWIVLNHPPYHPQKKLSSTKPVPGAKNVGDRCAEKCHITCHPRLGSHSQLWASPADTRWAHRKRKEHGSS